jgi:N-succinyldiaminopimelate aminotransferase
MTDLERQVYLHRHAAAVNVTWGYPEDLSPNWIRRCQMNPPAGFLDVPPGEYEAVIRGWFAQFFGCDSVNLVPSCSFAFAIAARTLTQSPGDEFIVIDNSYDSYPQLLSGFGARVVYAGRDADGNPDPESVAAACTDRTRAVVVVCPDNPLGSVPPTAVMERLIALCRERDLTLLVDYCLAAMNPFGRQIPLVPQMAEARNLSWIALGDTGKVLGLGGSKFGALMYSSGWKERLEAVQSSWFFQHNHYDLAVIATIVSDPRFPRYLRLLCGQVAANYLSLREQLSAPLRVQPMSAGCFALIDAAGLNIDDVSYARLLRERYSVLVVPMSWFPSGGPAAPETRVRVSLNRPGATIARLTAALNDSVASAVSSADTERLGSWSLRSRYSGSCEWQGQVQRTISASRSISSVPGCRGEGSDRRDRSA